MKFTLFNIVFLSFIINYSQNNFSYSILNNNCTARNSSLGGYPIGVIDTDPSLTIFLPSNISKLNIDKFVINYNNHFADSDFGMINYNFNFKNKGNFQQLYYIIIMENLNILMHQEFLWEILLLQMIGFFRLDILNNYMNFFK